MDIEIKLNIDDELLKEYEARNSPSFFGISLYQDGQFYPSEDWTDFGAVILNWWILVLIHLLGRGRCQKFLFMDGPYAVEVRHRRSTNMIELRPQGLGFVWEVPPSELAEAVAHAAETVVQKLAKVETGKQEREGLEQAVSKLREAMKIF
jgi:hypothetical protein